MVGLKGKGVSPLALAPLALTLLARALERDEPTTSVSGSVSRGAFTLPVHSARGFKNGDVIRRHTGYASCSAEDEQAIVERLSR